MRCRRQRRGEALRRPYFLFSLLCLALGDSAIGFHATSSNAATTVQYSAAAPSPTFHGSNSLPRGTLFVSREDSSASSSPRREKEEGPPRERAKLRGKLPIVSRTVPLGIFLEEAVDECNAKDGGGEEELSATVWEVEHPSEMMEMWWSSGARDKEKIGDPFGVVMWPGSILAAKEMARHRDKIEGGTVLVLGAGTGLEAQAAAVLGAKKVIATDINKLTLKLLDFGAEKKGLGSIIQSQVFDLFSEQDLPECDVVVAADILYNEMLGAQMGLRCTELLGKDDPPGLIVTDSQRFAGTDFLPFVNKVMDNWGEPRLSWEETVMEGFTGSGMLIEGDQTYDVTVRILSIGWGVDDS